MSYAPESFTLQLSSTDSLRNKSSVPAALTQGVASLPKRGQVCFAPACTVTFNTAGGVGALPKVAQTRSAVIPLLRIQYARCTSAAMATLKSPVPPLIGAGATDTLLSAPFNQVPIMIWRTFVALRRSKKKFCGGENLGAYTCPLSPGVELSKACPTPLIGVAAYQSRDAVSVPAR